MRGAGVGVEGKGVRSTWNGLLSFEGRRGTLFIYLIFYFFFEGVEKINFAPKINNNKVSYFLLFFFFFCLQKKLSIRKVYR